jgi:hypothetical protein
VIDGSEGFLRFCSATLARLDGTPWYLTGEEEPAVSTDPPTGHGGSSVAVNARTGAWHETPQFGLFAHENVVPLRRLCGRCSPRRRTAS